ncbi:hypothetical protein CCR75_002468 [Bremia lactucae]|uniref:Cyclin-dependent kinase 2 homolog n=1 Tax=Bremia lactucae TaxID=4779 RepID=A0A976I9U7_BRELC|nr:hypothetical protein CCR75_002468 [Bremia lactucae]
MKRRKDGVAAKRLGMYEKHAEIGRGTYGTVYLGHHVNSGAKVAIKKVFGPLKAGRHEADILAKCQGAQHVVQLIEVVERHDKLYLVLEHMDSDLEVLLSASESVPTLEIAQVKAYLNMLLLGVQELHARGILHRDLKPSNLLLSKSQCCAKITDFGMATSIETQHDIGQVDLKAFKPKRSVQVMTRAYRAPEIFFGEERYGVEVDMWSIGCIFAEMVLRKPLADGASDIDQLSKIFAILGSPSENQWDEASALPFYLRFKDTSPAPLAEHFSMLSSAGVDLLSQMLQLNPKKRISVSLALQHEFLKESPVLSSMTELVIVEAPYSGISPVVEHTDVGLPEASRTFAIKGRRLL